MDTKPLQVAVSALWEAAIDATQWSDALRQVGIATGSAGACILSPNPEVGCLVNKELEEPFNLYFEEGWHELDLRRRGIGRLMQGQVLIDEDVVTGEDIAASPYYSDFLPRVGLKWWMATGFISGDNFYALAVQRGSHQARFTAEDKATLETIGPVLNQLGRLLDVSRNSMMGATLSTLERLSQAAVCLRSDGKVIDWNGAAEQLFGQHFFIRGRKAYFSDKRAGQEFELAFSGCLASGFGEGFVVVPRHDRTPLLLRFVKLHPAAQAPFFGAAVLITIREIAAPGTASGEILTKAYGLTRAEGRLASLLANGISLEDVAETLRISKETARNQLKAVFSKTGTHRQGELVAVLAGAR